MNKTIFMALSGGRGQRLWPLSRKAFPKQFVAVKGRLSLLELTLDRLRSAKNSGDQIGIVTNRDYYSLVEKNLDDDDICVVEPCGKNTAPAILLAALEVAEKVPGDPVIAFVPSDHYVGEQDLFVKVLRQAVDYAATSNDISLIGIQPSTPVTTYGYILAQSAEYTGPLVIERFLEKPSKEVAVQLITHHNVWWNTGIFIAKLSVFLRAFQVNTPELYKNMQDFRAGKFAYERLIPTQFDTAILEKTNNRKMFSASFTWRDLGDLDNFVECACQLSDSEHTNNLTLYGSNNMALSKKKMVAFLGVSNLCLIETDDIILIKKMGDSEQIKDLVSQLEHQGYENLL